MTDTVDNKREIPPNNNSFFIQKLNVCYIYMYINTHKFVSSAPGQFHRKVSFLTIIDNIVEKISELS